MKDAYLKKLHTYDSSDMTFWERQIPRDDKKDQWFPEVQREGKRDEKVTHSDFL